MNKKTIVTQKNIMKVADFLESACNHFKNNGNGCFHYSLGYGLEIACGWLNGYDINDNDIIKSVIDDNERICYGVNAGVKIDNPYESDYDYLNSPWFEDGEIWDSDISMRPDVTRRGYRSYARWFLEDFVDIVNANKKHKVAIYGDEDFEKGF